ncbi:HPr family phosphocarrier protein [Coxiella endosymbiont of Amblyomma americanum]|uniref:HPr family phosphocarrier protein n=1 Tax=Coxiella endosymbiont of Amblyomma americanum TaxID=325775 RepID=UPI00057FFE9A|nr:HPr family phosphocarrier protein [Coxiella endosymbiont of Amblyomma americanum]AJC50354.1 phosphocarrier protein HPr [Coxiella endosymbiont of Amblyomma americanum]AUJ59031.1 phosphocarrier protein HPr [Coxiella-like endosymbiont of Amblyomma americanum]
MIRKKLKIINKLGLHARAAIKLTNVASRYQSTILVHYNNRLVNAKSLMCLMVLAINCGSEIELVVTGDDEKEATTAIRKLISNRFSEEE